MRVTLDDIMVDDEASAALARDDASQLAKRAQTIEEEYENKTHKQLSLLEAANAIAFTRWPNSDNIRNFVSVPDVDLIKLFYENGMYDTPRNLDEGIAKPKAGLNNAYIAWPSVLAVYSAIHAALENPKRGPHLFFSELSCKHGLRLDLKKDPIVERFVSYEGVGEEYRNLLARAMLFSVPAELYQSTVHTAEIQELRGHVVGLLELDKILKTGGMNSLHETELSSFNSTAAENFGHIKERVYEDKELLGLFRHFEKLEENPVSNALLSFIRSYTLAAEKYHILRNIPVMRWIWGNTRPTGNGYSEIEYGKFPEMKKDNYHPLIIERLPELAK